MPAVVGETLDQWENKFRLSMTKELEIEFFGGYSKKMAMSTHDSVLRMVQTCPNIQETMSTLSCFRRALRTKCVQIIRGVESISDLRHGESLPSTA